MAPIFLIRSLYRNPSTEPTTVIATYPRANRNGTIEIIKATRHRGVKGKRIKYIIPAVKLKPAIVNRRIEFEIRAVIPITNRFVNIVASPIVTCRYRNNNNNNNNNNNI